jgi:hypothetical protein
VATSPFCGPFGGTGQLGLLPTWAKVWLPLRRPREEELRRFAEWGYYASSVEAVTGFSLYDEMSPFPMRLIQTVGGVPDPSYVRPRIETFSGSVLLGTAAGAAVLGVAYSIHNRRRKSSRMKL